MPFDSLIGYHRNLSLNDRCLCEKWKCPKKCVGKCQHINNKAFEIVYYTIISPSECVTIFSRRFLCKREAGFRFLSILLFTFIIIVIVVQKTNTRFRSSRWQATIIRWAIRMRWRWTHWILTNTVRKEQKQKQYVNDKFRPWKTMK